MPIKYKSQLGCGIYTVPDISLLLGYKPYKVRRYLKNYLDEKLWRSEYADKYSWSADSRHKAVNFYVLIELYTFFQLREYGLSTHRIVKARKEISNIIETPYPFANSEVLVHNKTIWYSLQNMLIETGSSQLNFKKVIESFAHKIEVSQDKMALRYWPDGRKSSVVVDPHHQFGQPVIHGTNINTEVIRSMYESGEKAKTICSLYDLTNEQFKAVIRFYKRVA